MNETNTNWIAKYNDTALNLSAPTDKEAWKLLGAKNESDRNLLLSKGFKVVKE
jgi:hypothetical protein